MRRSLLSVAACVLVSAFLVAQVAVGRIHGIVRDTSGAPLPGVTVTLASGQTTRATTTTDAAGEFAFRDIAAGAYTVTAALTGFSTMTISATVSSGVTRELSMVLTVGALPETITVTGASQAADVARPTGKGGGTGGGIYRAGMASAPAPPAMFGRFNTEAYDKIDDNHWFAVAHDPLSTFSTDVDTASYANVRRFLNQGQIPPKDAVRIEEMINYFAYDYPQPTDGKPFTITTALDACPWNAHHRLALIGLQARRLDSEHTPPRNLVFLIDVSGSMWSPDKLPLVKASLAMLARNLTNRDRVALVVYAGNAGLVLPSTPGDDQSTILEALGRLEAGGSTNGAQGLLLAYQVARDHFISGGVNRVVIATDGDFNVGVTSEGDLIRLIEKNRETGVSLSVLGFGKGNLKDATMEKLADRGNGNYAYIDTLAEAEKVLVEEAGGTLVTVAKDVKLQVEFNPRVVGAYRLIGYENRVLQHQDFNDDKKDAGDMGAGHSVTALYEIVPAGEPLDLPGIDPLKYQQTAPLAPEASREEALTVKVRYKQPDGATSTLLSVPVPSRTVPSPALGFAAAVAEFGMVLRDSEFKGASTYADALTRATTFKGADGFGHRAEFIRLVRAADGISHVQQTGRLER